MIYNIKIAFIVLLCVESSINLGNAVTQPASRQPSACSQKRISFSYLPLHNFDSADTIRYRYQSCLSHMYDISSGVAGAPNTLHKYVNWRVI